MPGRARLDTLGHHAAIQDPTYIVEYDNTQNDANHIHSVWRTFIGDWTEHLLAEHDATSPADFATSRYVTVRSYAHRAGSMCWTLLASDCP